MKIPSVLGAVILFVASSTVISKCSNMTAVSISDRFTESNQQIGSSRDVRIACGFMFLLHNIAPSAIDLSHLATSDVAGVRFCCSVDRIAVLTKYNNVSF